MSDDVVTRREQGAKRLSERDEPCFRSAAVECIEILFQIAQLGCSLLGFLLELTS